jgi:serine protease AprX
MKKLIVVLIGSCLLFTEVNAQFNRHVVQFKDKGGTPYSFANPSTYLSARAISRRTRYSIGIDSTDLPITPRYLDSIGSVPNVTILNRSKWLNQVTIFTNDAAALTKINSFPFVQSASPIAPRLINGPVNAVDKFRDETVTPLNLNLNLNLRLNLNYGQTFNQINIHNGQFLHDRGLQGESMVIAVLDGGFFSYKTNPAFDSIRLSGRVLGEWDFVNNDGNVDEDSPHGMNCLSTIAANRPGIMVGTAIHARFWLLKTEYVFNEYPIEEHNWIAGAEFADSVGTDVISSSLGYQDFDNPVFDHLYAQRNGNTAPVTIAADLAAKKGIIVMNSAGNYGNLADQRKFISCPADGDSVVAVGAVTNTGAIAGFSSWGPNSAGKVKPNIVSVGQGTVVSDNNGSPANGNGTSFANPNIAGLITCLWGAYPEFNNMKIIDAVQRSSHRFNNPDDRFGYGIPNMRTAYYLLKADKSQGLFGEPGWFKANPNPFTDRIDAAFIADNAGNVKLYLKDITNAKLDSATFTELDSLDYRTHSFMNLGGLPGGYYYVQYKSATKDSTITLRKGAELFNSDWIKVFPVPFNSELHVYFTAQNTGTASLGLYDAKGSLIAKAAIAIQRDNVYYYQFGVTSKLSHGVYFIRFDDGVNKRSIRILK